MPVNLQRAWSPAIEQDLHRRRAFNRELVVVDDLDIVNLRSGTRIIMPGFERAQERIGRQFRRFDLHPAARETHAARVHVAVIDRDRADAVPRFNKVSMKCQS